MRLARHLLLTAPLVLDVACAKQAVTPEAPIASHEVAAPAEPRPVEAAQPEESEELADETAETDETPQMPLERRARIVKVEDIGGATAVTVAAGTADGIDRNWHACVLDAASGIKCLTDGELLLVRVDKQTLIAKSRLTPAQLTTNPMVQLKTP